MFGKEEVDMKDCEHAFRETFPAKDEHILVLFDTLYSHCISKLKVHYCSCQLHFGDT